MSTPPTMPKHDLGSLKIDDRSRRGGKTGKLLSLFAAAVGAVVVLVGLAWAFRGQTPTVEVATARPAGPVSAEALLNASGYVTPRRRATVAAKVTGLVQEVFAEEGLHVKSGQVLARLDCSQPLAALNSAKADRDAAAAALADFEVQLVNANRELKRTESLHASGVSSQQQLDTAGLAADSLKAKINLTREQTAAAQARIGVSQQDVDNCTVRAPFDGIIVSKDAQRGEIVSPLSAGGGFTRTGIATIVDPTSIEVEVDVNESYIARVKEGQRVISTLDAYPEWQIPSKVRTVIPTADRQKATVKVRVAFDQLDPRILPDMGVKVAFLSDEPKQPKGKANAAVALVPQGAVRREGENAVLFLVRSGKVERRAVSLGAQRGADVEIMAGAVPGDMFVLRGAQNLRDGQSVEIKK